MRLYIEPEAEAELEEAARQYEEAVPGLGLDFLLEMRERTEQVLGAPLTYPVFGDAQMFAASTRSTGSPSRRLLGRGRHRTRARVHASAAGAWLLAGAPSQTLSEVLVVPAPAEGGTTADASAGWVTRVPPQRQRRGARAVSPRGRSLGTHKQR